MGYALVHSRALLGLQAPAVRVEVHLSNGLPCLQLVGLADTEVREARERVRAALLSSGLPYPHHQRVTVSLAPADLPKASGRFDLPIALGILAAQGLIDADTLNAHEFAGELSLSGELQPVPGALALAMGTLHDNEHPSAPRPQRALVLPPGNAEEACRVQGVAVYRVDHLAQCAAADGQTQSMPWSRCLPPTGIAPSLPLRGADLQEVWGHRAAKRALEIAAAGQHHLLMVGPPGSGKSMLAQRLAPLLPPLNDDQALASAAVHSLGSAGFQPQNWRRRPCRAPHHSCSAAALVGGGNPPRPGEISLAHCGVLFLDELPEFPSRALECLREPLETGEVVLARAGRQARFPAQVSLVAAMNPCPCGWLGSRHPSAPHCRCTPEAVERYQQRLSGPLLDRFDLRVMVDQVGAPALLDAPAGEATAAVAERVAAAHARQSARQGKPNRGLNADELQRHAPLEAAARDLLAERAAALGWSGRGLHRVWRVARTLADLDHEDLLQRRHVAEAIQLRRSLPNPHA